MKLTDLIDVIEANGKSVRAYRECARIANEQLLENPKDASAFFVLGVAAQRFVESYDDQPLDEAGVAKAFERFSSFVSTLVDAGEGAEARLTALNEVSLAVIDQKL